MKKILVAVLVIALVSLIYMALGCKKNSSPAAPTPTSVIVGNDRDSHGCIGSAGYSWCEKKHKCIRVWEEKCE
jgi:hypothetical protein